MRLLALALAAGLLAAPVLAQTAAPASDTIKAVTAKGVTMSVQGMDFDIDFTPDGNFTGAGGQFAGTWKADGKKLCLTIPGMIDNQCTEYPDGKKSGDSFDITNDQGSITVKIR
jgi:hypothetical protein